MRSSACARHFILQSKIQNKITRHVTAPPDGESHRAVFQVCHCAPPDAAGFPDLSLRALRSKAWQSRSTRLDYGEAIGEIATAFPRFPRRFAPRNDKSECVSFEQWPVLIGSACRALSVTFGDSSPRGRAKGASRLAMTNLGALRRRMCAAKIARLHGAQGAPLQTQSVRTILTAACTNCKCLPEIATSAYGLLAMTNLKAIAVDDVTLQLVSLQGAH